MKSLCQTRMGQHYSPKGQSRCILDLKKNVCHQNQINATLKAAGKKKRSLITCKTHIRSHKDSNRATGTGRESSDLSTTDEHTAPHSTQPCSLGDDQKGEKYVRTDHDMLVVFSETAFGKRKEHTAKSCGRKSEQSSCATLMHSFSISIFTSLYQG